MTASTTQEARDDVYSLVVEAWGTEGPIDFWDKPRNPNADPIPPKTPTPWLRIKMTHTDGRQASLTGGLGVKNRRFRRYGLVEIQVFTPLGSSLREPDRLGTLVMNALEGASTPHDVLFRRVRKNEVGSDGHWFQVNVYADFEYDTIR